MLVNLTDVASKVVGCALASAHEHEFICIGSTPESKYIHNNHPTQNLISRDLKGLKKSLSLETQEGHLYRTRMHTSFVFLFFLKKQTSKMLHDHQNRGRMWALIYWREIMPFCIS